MISTVCQVEYLILFDHRLPFGCCPRFATNQVVTEGSVLFSSYKKLTLNKYRLNLRSL